MANRLGDSKKYATLHRESEIRGLVDDSAMGKHLLENKLHYAPARRIVCAAAKPLCWVMGQETNEWQPVRRPKLRGDDRPRQLGQ